ncbi:hypothetical protein F511_09578 [Dorcoceras hygrometricum]|uniref:Uncharacterized protein n=1 Tax=Dorcoceras hygrometricum TaxID=472368 RepID=A0A2Z7CPG7_9LAMI|nr:hypothetical protein F511_09578 [Dorcoceras hygrometricum]
MSGGGGRLSKIGIVLIIIFAVSLVMLLTQLFYVLWRRRVFRRNVGGGDHFSQHSSSESSFSSKELLYFFCVRRHPSSMTAPDSADGFTSHPRPEMEVIDVDLLKIHGMFGPPRFLFTIKEEEGEHTESPAEVSLRFSVEAVNKIDDDDGKVTLKDCFEAAEEPPETAVAVKMDDHFLSDTTPFSTPCESPMYFTPSASPVHEVVNCRSTETGGVCGSKTSSLLRSVG